MIESLIITLLPVIFLIVLFGGGAVFRRRNIDMDGVAPIGTAVFISSKYAIVLLWVCMIFQSWGVRLSIFEIPEPARSIALLLFILGFLLLFAGRFEMGSSFRIGSPKEDTKLKVNGLFRFSRNPMYLGVYTTILASVVYTLNPILLAVCIFVIAVHHQIVLAEEQYLLRAFGEEYREYCAHVRRYI
ncbi:MAG: isoprenylcysteine carboxylmethyltransferase family protein [candidate division Zixibacteria bacterium]|nr:isoprenylcysteine carboxylmethyltransferase family protein [candidate division Zixibacteria bacterium]